MAIIPPDLFELGLKGMKRSTKFYNYRDSRKPDDYIPNRLEEEFDKARREREARERESLLRAPRRAVRRLRRAALTKTSFLKSAVQTDGLGKQTSPAVQGGSVDAPMPQTEYAKGTLSNEYANRLNKRQLAEMQRLQQQQGSNGSSQSSGTSTTTTSSDGTTTTTTTSGLSNSGLLSALSVGSVL